MNVLITGANRGLGLEFTKQYAEDGATVFACCRDPYTASVLRKISDEAGGKVSVHALDVASPQSIAALGEAFGAEPIDLLINNAGVYGPAKQSADEMDYEGWADTFAINAMAPLRLAQTFRKNLQMGRGKKLVTITSGMGSTARHDGGYFAYRASKAAVNNVMHGLSVAWKKDGITVVLIHPGWVKTDMGGKNADLEPHESIAGMKRVIAKLTPADSGKFFDYAGKEMPW
jgi:NAD(P)-dependent dehydrogenase (short-subunit alcohol dehydrogenase family)